VLTRLQIQGFKNLRSVDIKFGPFTCIAGANGVGKSNLFDAIHFLSLLANKTIHEAAAYIRDESGRSSDIRSLFHIGPKGPESKIRFVADMIIPKTGMDDFNQEASATTTFLQYELELRWVKEGQGGRIAIALERLAQLPRSRAKEFLGFPFSRQWEQEVLIGKRNVPYLSTDTNEQKMLIIKRHQDGGSSGKPLPVPADNLPRTLLSRSDAFEAPTALCARREMESWIQLQLEPSSLRVADTFSASPTLSASGAHLPSTLYRLTTAPGVDPDAVFQTLTNRLKELVPEIRSIRVDRDEKRELFTLKAVLRDGTEHEARSLSDGTLRFLALTVLEVDPAFQGVVCFEEPENGIHPKRLPAIIRLLQEIAVNPMEPADESNPLRQVIINTHSPAVVLQVLEESLLIARGVDDFSTSPSGRSFQVVCLDHTWRATCAEPMNSISTGMLGSYFNPIEDRVEGEEMRVVDRDNDQLLFSKNHGF
jgi:predicted ATPase